MSGAILLLPINVVMLCMETTLPFYHFTEYMCFIVRTDVNWFILHKNVNIDNM